MASSATSSQKHEKNVTATAGSDPMSAAMNAQNPPVNSGFTNISLEDPSSRDPENPPKRKKKKVPRRILHFSDGILEEYSTDDEPEEVEEKPVVDPKTLAWHSWLWHYITVAASNTLFVADSCGEKLAWYLGITSPKYQYAIDEHNRIKAEEEADRLEEEMIKQQLEGPTADVTHKTQDGLDNVPEIAICDTTDKTPIVEKY